MSSNRWRGGGKERAGSCAPLRRWPALWVAAALAVAGCGGEPLAESFEPTQQEQVAQGSGVTTTVDTATGPVKIVIEFLRVCPVTVAPPSVNLATGEFEINFANFAMDYPGGNRTEPFEDSRVCDFLVTVYGKPNQRFQISRASYVGTAHLFNAMARVRFESFIDWMEAREDPRPPGTHSITGRHLDQWSYTQTWDRPNVSGCLSESVVSDTMFIRQRLTLTNADPKMPASVALSSMTSRLRVKVEPISCGP